MWMIFAPSGRWCVIRMKLAGLPIRKEFFQANGKVTLPNGYKIQPYFGPLPWFWGKIIEREER